MNVKEKIGNNREFPYPDDDKLVIIFPFHNFNNYFRQEKSS